MYELRFNGTAPPNTEYQYIAHPLDPINKAIKIAVMVQHRFAFQFWTTETGRLLDKGHIQTPPNLISLDWHQDLAGPSANEKNELGQLVDNDFEHIEMFSYGRLNPLNDGHIYAAAYINSISDIYLLCKQENDISSVFVDRNGNEHQTHVFYTIEDLMTSLQSGNGDQPAYLDIDLDFFTESSDRCGGGPDTTIVSEEQITSIINIDSDLIQYSIPSLEGITIALEPAFCTGITGSLEILKTIESNLFDGKLLSGNCKWKHLSI